jgi:hypothetical protein
VNECAWKPGSVMEGRFEGGLGDWARRARDLHHGAAWLWAPRCFIGSSITPILIISSLLILLSIGWWMVKTDPS